MYRVTYPGVKQPARESDQSLSPPHPTPTPSSNEFIYIFTFCTFWDIIVEVDFQEILRIVVLLFIDFLETNISFTAVIS
jgi:hypothetical protein